ncbi:hypothetical protein Y032_0750g2043 [Ancylostoma ceylanicum]|uniref:Uncharacterized protein n=1 Tax=Ancylostoma ceylanicum TaxID=53326 RepID=A0A016WEJ1_9BILA|nr:hypothetical protein Y032_0750g2043 [Ancylostoma ceylanicum]
MAELSLPKTGYLPGEMVLGSIKVGNKYPKDILQHVSLQVKLTLKSVQQKGGSNALFIDNKPKPIFPYLVPCSRIVRD